jgi:hypothetical protein
VNDFLRDPNDNRAARRGVLFVVFWSCLIIVFAALLGY